MARTNQVLSKSESFEMVLYGEICRREASARATLEEREECARALGRTEVTDRDAGGWREGYTF